MLTILTLTNFQKHREPVTFQFSPTVNVIVGPNHAGKTAIIRALQVLIQNPRGSANFISHGEKSFTITAEIDDQTLTRERTATSNTYTLNGATFKALGTQIPEDIEHFLNFHPCSFQLQHDQPFWLFDSPPDVTKKLNQIVDLDIIDRTIEATSKLYRQSKTKLGVVEERLQEIRQEKEELEWIEQCAAEHAALEEKQVYLEQMKEYIAYVQTCRDRLFEYQRFQRQKKRALEQGRKVVELGQQVLTLNKRLQRAQELKTKLLTLKKRKRSIPNLKPLQALRERGDAVAVRCQSIEVQMRQLQQLLEHKKSIQEELKETKEALARLPKPKRCPTCKQLLIPPKS